MRSWATLALAVFVLTPAAAVARVDLSRRLFALLIPSFFLD